MKSDFLIALTQLAAERDLPREIVMSAIEAALASAYKKDSVTAGQNIAVRLNPSTGDVRVFVLMKVVDAVEDPRTELTLAQAKKFKSGAAVGDTIEIESTLQMGGRIAAQTAKQVVMQRLREAERELVFEEYAGRADEVVSSTVHRVEGRDIIVDLGKAEALLPEREQVSTERCRPGQKLKVYIVEVGRTAKGPQVIVSRSHKNLLRRLFEIEVPEIYNGIVEIKAIAREAGSRSKVAVSAKQEGVDAVGSCVGLRGIRIQNIVNELQGEKIDVVQWHKDPTLFIANALNPAQVMHVELSDDQKTATVVVQEKMLSLAIGRDGQNARLAAKLTGWKIDILSSADAEVARRTKPAPVREEQPKAAEAAAKPVQEETIEEQMPVAEAAPVTIEAEAPTAQAEAGTTAAETEASAPQVAPAAEEGLDELEVQESEEEEPAQEQQQEAIPITDDVWKVPILVPSNSSQIRFAEDIMFSRGDDNRRRGKRGRREGEETGKAKRAAERRRRGGDSPAPG